MVDEELAVPGMALVSKTGAILQALRDGELTVTELSAATGEPASSLYRVLSALERLGWVEQGTRRGYTRLGLELVRLGQLVENQLDLRTVALPELRALNTVTTQTVFLCVRRDMQAACIERIDGADVQIHNLRLGESMPLGQGTAPRSILAFESRDVIEQYLQSMPMDKRFGIVASTKQELQDQLEQIKLSGVSVSRGDLGAGIGGVGAPVFDHRGKVIAAVSISGLTHQVFDSDFDPVALVTGAAARISQALGYQLDPSHHAQKVGL